MAKLYEGQKLQISTDRNVTEYSDGICASTEKNITEYLDSMRAICCHGCTEECPSGRMPIMYYGHQNNAHQELCPSQIF